MEGKVVIITGATSGIGRETAIELAKAGNKVVLSGRLGKKRLTAYQASERGGVLYCENQRDKVLIGGECVPFAKSTLYL